MPLYINEIHPQTWLTQERYKKIKWSGIAVIIVVSLALAVTYYFDNSEDANNMSVLGLSITFLILVELILFVCILLMFDTFRRMKLSFA